MGADDEDRTHFGASRDGSSDVSLGDERETLSSSGSTIRLGQRFGTVSKLRCHERDEYMTSTYEVNQQVRRNGGPEDTARTKGRPSAGAARKGYAAG